VAATHSYQSSPGPSNLRSSLPVYTLALIGLLNAIFQLENPIVSVVILNPFSYQEFAEGTPVVVDVRCWDSAGQSLHVEMQVSVYFGLIQRLVSYACGMYVD